MKFAKQIEIQAQPERVYEYLLDITRHSEWTTPGHRVHVTKTSDGETKVGSTFLCEAHQFGAQRDTIVITELVPARRITYEVTMKDGNRFRHTLELAPTGQGTLLTKTFEALKLNFASRMFMPVGKIIAPRLAAGDVTRIKANLETAHPI